jgi:hypothetical protein
MRAVTVPHRASHIKRSCSDSHRKRGHPAVSLCVYIVDDVGSADSSRRVASVAGFHHGVIVPGANGAELVRTR